MTVCRLHALARSGSSVTAYAAASPWGYPVGDEVLGPWPRTGPLYPHPPEQAELVDLFKAEGHRLTPPVVALTRLVMAKIKGNAPFVVSKWPHLRPSPEEWREAFPEDRAVYLIRNPLHRLNSLYCRGQLHSFGPNQDLYRYKQYMAWWRVQPHRVSFDQFKQDPGGFFRTIWNGWEWPFDESHVAHAVAYAREHYHSDSKRESDRPEGGVLSETRFALPESAIERYLSDDEIREFMVSMGWSVRQEDYLDRA
ncbi:MAG: hypothetical protein KF866_08680 [Phycisphaeraceae bacterium]|nr:hypothetical protein [Phycisphaeraceae bacterium]MCW5753952.1 hypothetical protein [Phycisphaeraceae bacterium]